jgi:hypothetical protein
MRNCLVTLALWLGVSWAVLSRVWIVVQEQFRQLFPQLNGQQSVEALRQFIGLLPFIILWLIISILWGNKSFAGPKYVHQASQAKAKPNSVSWAGPVAWIVGSGLAIALVVGIVIYVDPNGLYGTKIYQPLYLCTRDEKATAYLVRPTPPELVILGSSRAFSLSPSYIQATMGLSAFNAATGGASPQDFLIMARFIFEHTLHNPPKILLVEVNPGLGGNPKLTAFCTPLHMLRYADAATAVAGIQDRVNGLLDPKQLTDSIYSIRYNQLYGSPDVYWKFDSVDGQGVARPTSDLEARLKEEILLNKPFYTSNPPCEKSQPCALSADGVRYTNELIALAQQHNTAVVFYTAAIHPTFYNEYYEDNHVWQAASAALVDYMDSLSIRYDNVYFLDYSKLESFGGLDTVDGWYNATHMTTENNNRILNAAAETLRQAYQWAENRRHLNAADK